jgi:POT family proton-dependent oligopeptide transporter
MSADAVAAPAAKGEEAFGHPRGLWYLCFCEGFERFSYYGMQALLVLYLTKYLLLPGHIEHVIGFAQLKAALQTMYGPLATPVAVGAAVTGVYSSGVYITPLIGGFIADRLLGRTATVMIGCVLMVLGHFLMAFDVSFVAAILCLFIGVGCFKGNIAAQVGELYAINDLRRSEGFQLFFLGIQISVFFAPLVTGGLGAIAWHWGFGAAGVGMTIAMFVYLAGRKHLPPDHRALVAEQRKRGVREHLTGRDWAAMALLVVMLPVLAASAIGNQEIFNAYLLWGDKHYDLTFFGQRMPTAWLVSLDAGVSFVTMIAVVAFWRWYGTRWKEPDEIIKIAIGSLIAATGPLMLALASAIEAATGQKASLVVGLGFHILNDIGFAMVFPVGLALYSRAAPKAVGGVFIGVYYLHLAVCNFATGKLAGLVDSMSGVSFWSMHAAIIAGAGVVMFVLAFLFRGLLAPTAEEAAQNEAAEVAAPA